MLDALVDAYEMKTRSQTRAVVFCLVQYHVDLSEVTMILQYGFSYQKAFAARFSFEDEQHIENDEKWNEPRPSSIAFAKEIETLYREAERIVGE